MFLINFLLGPKSVFLGYCNSKKCYKLFSLDTKQIIISRDVVFYENIFPYKMKDEVEVLGPIPSQDQMQIRGLQREKVERGQREFSLRQCILEMKVRYMIKGESEYLYSDPKFDKITYVSANIIVSEIAR